MFKLLIVDDEPIIVQRLQMSIDWYSIGFSKIYAAYNGTEALEIVEKIKPDVIISDVCMPSLDGLSLVKALRERQLDTQVVLVSGFSDFKYVKQALDYGCAGYVTKPIDEEEMLAAVRKCVHNIEKARYTRRINEQLKEALPYAQERFWNNAILRKYPDPKMFSEEGKKVDLKYPNTSYLCLCIGIHFDEETEYAKRSLLTNATVFDLTNLFSNIHLKFFCFSPAIGEAVGFVFSDEPYKTTDYLKTCATEIQNAVNFFDGCTAKFGLSKVTAGWEHVPDAYQAAKWEIQKQDSPAVHSAKQSVFGKNTDLVFVEELCACIINQDLESSRSIIATYLDAIPDSIAGYQLCSLGFEIASQCTQHLVKAKQLEDANTSELSYILLPQLQNVRTKKDLGDFLIQISRVLASDISMEDEDNSNHIIQDILKYAEEHYPEPISSRSVAEHFYFNPSYFSRLFSSKMGIRFTSYLTNLRIAKAEEMMLSCNMRTADIAAAVGFTDARYFYKIYKSIKGITPKQFREQNAKVGH